MSVVDRITRGTMVRVGGVRAEIRAVSPQQAQQLNRTSPPGALGMQNYWQGRGMPQPEQFSASSGIEGAYLANLYVYRCVDTIAKALSALAFRSGLDPDKRGSFNSRAPLAQLLGPAPGSPNPQWSARQLWRYAAAQYVITGKMAWAKGYDDEGQINALWPLSVQFLNPIPGPPTGTNYFAGFKYGNPGNPLFTTYDVDKIVYIWRPSLKDFRQPESVIQAAQMNVSVLRMIDTYDYTFLKNNAVPSTLVVTEPFAEKEQRRAFRDQFVSEFTGYANAGKTLFLESGFDDGGDEGPGSVKDTMSVQRVGLTQKEAQQSETRDAKIRDTCVAMGVPLSVLMDSSLSKFQNADQDWRNFWGETMMPLLNELSDGINTSLAPELGREVGWFDVSKVAALQAPKTFKPEDGVQLVTSRIITRDEYRTDLGLPPYAEVDPENLPVQYPNSPTTPAGTPVDAEGSTADGLTGDVGKPIKPVVPAPVKPPTPTTDVLGAARARRALRKEAETRAAQLAIEGAKPAGLEVRSARSALALEIRHSGTEGHLPIPGGHVHDGSTPDHIRKAFESMLSSSMTSLFAEQGKYVADRLAGRRGRKLGDQITPEQVFDGAYWRSRTVGVLQPLFTGLAAMEGRTAQFETSTEDLGRDITADTIGRMGLAMAGKTSDLMPALMQDVFDTGPQRAFDLVLAQLQHRSPEAAHTRTVPRNAVEQALLRIYQGKSSVEAAITELTGVAS
jgi:HK97 family phage portal protein